MIQHERPVFLDLLRMHLPVGGWVSFLHRVSGAVLFLAFPAAVWGLAVSLGDETGFERVSAWLGQPGARLTVLLLVWALAHHLFAGLRHLVLDMHGCVARRCARASAWAVLAGGIATAAWAALRLFG